MTPEQGRKLNERMLKRYNEALGVPLRRPQDKSDLIFLIDDFHRKQKRPWKIALGIVAAISGLSIVFWLAYV